jgi:hypothetical protein
MVEGWTLDHSRREPSDIAIITLISRTSMSAAKGLTVRCFPFGFVTLSAAKGLTVRCFPFGLIPAHYS